MRVKCVKAYYDLELKKNVSVGEEFDVTTARGQALTSTDNKAGMVLCEELVAATDAPEGEPVKKSRKKKEA